MKHNKGAIQDGSSSWARSQSTVSEAIDRRRRQMIQFRYIDPVSMASIHDPDPLSSCKTDDRLLTHPWDTTVGGNLASCKPVLDAERRRIMAMRDAAVTFLGLFLDFKSCYYHACTSHTSHTSHTLLLPCMHLPHLPHLVMTMHASY